MDRNTLIGFGLIGVLLITMFAINSKSRLAYEAEQKRIADSIAATLPKVDTARKNIAALDTANKVQQPIVQVAEEKILMENDVMSIEFTNKGAQPVNVILKNYRKADSTKLILQQGAFNKLGYSFLLGDNKTAKSTETFFTIAPVVQNADKSQSLRFTWADSAGKKIVHQYTLKPGEYMVDLSLEFTGVEQLFTGNRMALQWQTETEQLEKDHKYELTQTHIAYNQGGDFDFEYIKSGGKKKFEKPVNWLAVKQQFFVSALIAKGQFSTADISWITPTDSSLFITQTTVNASLLLPLGQVATVPLQIYYGPSDYNVLKRYGNELKSMVPYGSGVFAFVKYINRYFLLPVFDFIRAHVASMGIVILLLTLLIRLITSPILYKSYLSGAKMKLLKPEVDALKAKYKDDQQAFGMEQMKLWRSAGVSPLGGCLPAVLQIPIFMSLYYFFQSNIDLRGESFLWASDLSAYDSIYNLPFKIPFYGDHVSLFTLTATLTSLLISIYSMSNMQDQNNPLMKYMPYIFPVLLLGVFNSLPSALTWYYTVSNTITLILQIVIQKYIIDHDKIMVQINENRKKPVKKSKMQERIEAMQESQKKIQDMRGKAGKK